MTKLNAIGVLKRYCEEDLPEFSSIVSMSIEHIGIFGNRPLHIACIRGNLEEARALISGGANVNATGEHRYTPLHEAVEKNNFEIVRLLLQYGANPFIENAFGDTPLDIARTYARQDVLELLMSRSDSAQSR